MDSALRCKSCVYCDDSNRVIFQTQNSRTKHTCTGSDIADIVVDLLLTKRMAP